MGQKKKSGVALFKMYIRNGKGIGLILRRDQAI